MNMDMKQSFTVELELLISQYISKGMQPGLVEEIMQQAIEGMFENMSEVDAE
jgi:hypothetical protein